MEESRHVTKLGELNGWTSSVFKVQLVVTPVFLTAILGGLTWIVSSVNELARNQAVISERVISHGKSVYSRESARADMLVLQREILTEVADKYPPQYWTDQIRGNAQRLATIEAKDDFRKQTSSKE